MIRRVLVANRGEIAVRVIHACQALGLETVLAASEVDRDSLAARMADRTVCIGPAASALSYLRVDALLAAATGTGCDALHPGYGFLSESESLAAACAAEGVTFIGPTPEQILRMGNKLQARALAREAGVPMLPGSEKVADAEAATRIADAIGYPVLLKAAAGGGGRGMKVVADAADMGRQFAAASAEARNAFGDDTLYLERFIGNARHVEVQVLGDAHGALVHLGERDCSLQRRHQKLVEESPCPVLDEKTRAAMGEAAVRLAKAANYYSAGTVEFLLDKDKNFYFIEINSRIQVEHPVTEMVTDTDLIREMILVAAGNKLSFRQEDIKMRGHAMEFRINAEDPDHNFKPSPGKITTFVPPAGPGVRWDSHIYQGYSVPPHYDSMVGKLIIYRHDRKRTLEVARRALQELTLEGITTTAGLFLRILEHSDFCAGEVDTGFIDRYFTPR